MGKTIRGSFGEEDDEDDGQGVGLDGAFVSDKLHFTGGDLSRRSRRRQVYDDGIYSESSGDDYGSDDGAGGTKQIALRDKEELLVQRALERIRRAQMLGRTNVKLTQLEIDALERKRRKDEAESAGEKPEIRTDHRRRSSGQSRDASREQKSSKRKTKDYFPAYDGESSSTSRRAMPPGFFVPGPAGVPAYSPLGYYPPSAALQGGSSRSGSRSASSHSLARASPPLPRTHKQRYSSVPDPQPLPAPRSPQSSRRLPDDPNWMPRPRSSSSVSSQPYSPDQYQAYSPPLPPIPHHYSQGRRVVSSPQPDVQVQYPRIRGEPQTRSSESSSLRREQSRQSTPERSESEEGSASDDDEDDGVQVDVVPYSQGYGVSVRPEGARERQRRGQR
ncbi:hypothetical protein IMSHALPRED_002700 [Imshaugia aleurites]|uniref:Uncharacterized protein n=1 Tax=Imshaugia aleurites TaxID=172621 RepID=A0A8H3I5L1_9LECA|nr:hypothetical protein IMSHALPRED_002700 [Imshaugia aleurites]